jgi:hypothetical protein
MKRVDRHHVVNLVDAKTVAADGSYTSSRDLTKGNEDCRQGVLPQRKVLILGCPRTPDLRRLRRVVGLPGLDQRLPHLLEPGGGNVPRVRLKGRSKVLHRVGVSPVASLAAWPQSQGSESSQQRGLPLRSRLHIPLILTTPFLDQGCPPNAGLGHDEAVRMGSP